MSMPSAVGRLGDESLDQRAKDRLVVGQRKSRSRLTVGRVGERLLGERGDMFESGIATEDLEQEPVKVGIGTEDPGSPTVPDLLTDPLDGRAIQKVAEVLPNPPQREINPSMHPRACLPMGRVTTPWCQEAFVCLKSIRIFDLRLA